MFEDYKDIFNQRARYYHQAMIDFPLAREEEFYHVLNIADISQGNIICDIPAGGGYLNNFIQYENKIISVETSIEFLSFYGNKGINQTIICNSMNEIPLQSTSIDRVISLAALHHVSNKKAFYQESLRLLKDKGILCIADVFTGTGVADFLNIFVDKYNPMGHKGDFLNETTKADLESLSFQVLSAAQIGFNWKFDSLENMVRFCKLLFYINDANDRQILKGIQKYLGYKVVDNQYCLPWELFFLKARKITG
ncbi:methyltransferase domain-containing protein [Anabaena cylindrica FACHB-243]|uniref:Methyltransferase type 11 n=1 Tax=Anabaena cylindrica (strain ATCC 27899 / PCC 7122) TaxID=272123 RepID=K9ZA72_ANACC|nr:MULTISPECIES: methyltransferase domain-containing protein [Anabaena]AFZ55624.1 Methyltransferase type 11 [Anabaena cylindrica PCC 7122]MBD2420436.1 methyltransferase domain-containing protein [Anabaena cylindrica FACHB-243]MBY5281836.1 methyltransferase domain-containing protein [Anabaena sp. CCAP 1446/1C]MBY5310057.1 methyltransferase domain-containing protein [Anabaena sp. CCAP 1446/1C]MCM2406938.1 class I SAM-dependent methyltransferase [Anabaena sp. CCAP 1446/1C]